MGQNKKVIQESIYEKIMSYSPGFSSIGNLVDENGLGSENINFLYKFSALVDALVNSPYQYLKTAGASKLPEIKINIKFPHLRKIYDDRSDSIRRGFLDDPKTVPADIEFNGEKFRVKLRLKGDLPTHWTADSRFSLRVNINENKANSRNKFIFGMRSFSLNKPRARQYPYEFIFQDLIESVGLIKTPHKLVKVKFNGDNWGIMDMQEHYSSTLLEKNKLRDSIILRVSDDKIWHESIRSGIKFNQISGEYLLSNPNIFLSLSGKKLSDLTPTQKLHYKYILHEMRKENYQDRLFDNQKLDLTNMILSLWGNFHPISSGNVRFYFNFRI